MAKWWHNPNLGITIVGGRFETPPAIVRGAERTLQRLEGPAGSSEMALNETTIPRTLHVGR